MKKVLASIFMAVSLVSFSDELVIRGGIDFADHYSGMSDFLTGDSGDDSLGFELSAEYLKNVSPNFLIGVGVGYQGHSKSEGKNVLLNSWYDSYGDYYEHTYGYEDRVYYDSVPLYITAKYEFDTPNTNVKPYVKANVGYSFNIHKNDLTLSDKVTQYVYDWYDDDYDKYSYDYASKSYDTDISNGLYYGIGGGVEINGLTLDLMYQANYAKAKIDNGDGTRQEHNLNIHRVTFGMGYAFNF
jgi:hypothetical protein